LHAENIFVGIVVPENKIFYAALDIAIIPKFPEAF
jgi:hypothetical protein